MATETWQSPHTRRLERGRRMVRQPLVPSAATDVNHKPRWATSPRWPMGESVPWLGAWFSPPEGNGRSKAR